ncbi:Mini-ribonuclease 3 [Shimazuella kribbensis]|uniref:Mini-ribonuclease 3 n=1 Tax=Shimazuella kribbensis TaxID=139808 RepID=UPI0004289EE8
MMEQNLLGTLGALMRKPDELPPLTLAYIGDAVQELYVRHHLIASGEVKPQKLQQVAVRYVSAAAQAHAIQTIMDQLKEEEIAVYKRGRNAKTTSVSRRVNVSQYRQGTGLETLLGYLYLMGQADRLQEIMKMLIELGPLEKEMKK